MSAGIDYQTITAHQQETWATGNFHEIARQNTSMAIALCEAVDPHPCDRGLDVACGSGTAALVAARRYCEMTGIDYVPALIERARQRAAAEGFEIDFDLADAQALPFAEASFDFVLSVYGVQFAPDQEQAARELLRVCRPGGKIGLASPMPQGWSFDFFSALARYRPPPPGLSSPLRWGTEQGLEALLGEGCHAIASEQRTSVLYFRSVDHATEVFLTYFGPAIRASQGSATAAQEHLRDDLRAVFSRYNRATDGTAAMENQFLLTMAYRE
ncbi:class I SAM-dependent methyltransferase [Leptolyngbya sp. KIOST-1]|uniref:class I SAM-dependent methyltransferase n=1 Tax=Leptolyngbya sp. KIOST-1 TaxID=1229172 RepID=UPI00055A4863|nr:class I SAM-dependent methyltransferase [Leptolyngbya sp. KIOST-1]